MDNCNNVQNSIWGCLFSLAPEQLAVLSTIIAILLAESLNLSQQNVLGNFLLNVGQTIAMQAAQGELLENSDNKNNNINRQLQILKRQICTLEQELNNQK